MSGQFRNLRNKWHSWWQHHGNRKLPELFFNPVITGLILYFIFLLCVPYTYTFFFVIVGYIAKQQIMGIIIPPLDAVIIFTVLTSIMVLLYVFLILVLLYVRKATIYTFKNERKTRKAILKRDRLSMLPRYSYIVFVVLAYLQVVSTIFLVLFLGTGFLSPFHNLLSDALTHVTATFSDYFPVFCTLAILSLITYGLVKLGVSESEKLAFIADSLVNLEEPQTSTELKKWKKEIEYFGNKFVTTFAQLGPFSHKIIKEVDLSFLGPVLLALFFGNDKEKNTAREMLRTLQERLTNDGPRVKINVVNWLSETRENAAKVIPRMKKIEEVFVLKLIRRRGILSKTPESLKYVDTIIKIMIGLATLSGLIWATIQVILAFIGKG
jgi:hypothetical protein